MDLDLTSGGLMTALVLGFLLGLRHATDADHVVAVSTIVSQERNPLRGIWIGVSWGLGHSTPLLVLGVVILLLKEAVLAQYQAVAPFLEFAVGVMLVVLGVQVFWRLRRNPLHIHEHAGAGDPHVHIHTHKGGAETAGDARASHKRPRVGTPFFRLKSYAIGVVHGLAGSAAVMLLLLPEVSSFGLGIAYILLFGLGTMISMATITLLLGLPFALTSHFEGVNRWIARVAGATSIVLGAALMSNLALGTHLLAFLPES